MIRNKDIYLNDALNTSITFVMNNLMIRIASTQNNLTDFFSKFVVNFVTDLTALDPVAAYIMVR